MLELETTIHKHHNPQTLQTLQPSNRVARTRASELPRQWLLHCLK
jgi:hypothetical protein